MKLSLQNWRKPLCYLCGNLLAIVTNLLLTILISPTDTEIVFMSIVRGNGEIYRTNPDREQPHRFTKHSIYNNTPAWALKKKSVLSILLVEMA